MVLKIPYGIAKATFLSGTTYRQLREWNERNCFSVGDSLETALTTAGFFYGNLTGAALSYHYGGKKGLIAYLLTSAVTNVLNIYHERERFFELIDDNYEG